MELGDQPLVETGAALFRELCYNYRDSLMAGILVAGWDKRKGGQVYSVPIGGMCVRQQVSIGGSGSTYVYGFVDANYRPGMSKEECTDFIIKSKLSQNLIRLYTNDLKNFYSARFGYAPRRIFWWYNSFRCNHKRWCRKKNHSR